MIYLTDEAKKRVRQQLNKRGQGIGIYVGVQRSGCSGYAYHLDFVDAVCDDQHQFDYGDFVVVIDQADLCLIEGLTLRVERQGLNTFFAFDNPKATATCGCGTSFSVS